MFTTRLRYLYIFLLGSYSYLNIKFTEGDSLLPQAVHEISLYLILLFTVFLIWEGNRFIGRWFYKEEGNDVIRPLLRHFSLSLLWVALLSVMVLAAISFFLEVPFQWFTLKQLIGFVFRVNLFLHCINAIVYYHHQTKSAQLKAEQLQKQSTEAQFDALRRQVNPHFLFNSFNTLSSLVQKDPETAAKFIEQLSEVYRYLLNVESKKLIPLKKEIEFLESYIFLLKIRFGENLRVDWHLEGISDSHYLVPSALQMLIENAIKHNEVSRKFPLSIVIEVGNDHVRVENNLQLKAVADDSTTIGLNNIRDRYVLLGEITPEVIQTDEKFMVKIPLIKIEEN